MKRIVAVLFLLAAAAGIAWLSRARAPDVPPASVQEATRSAPPVEAAPPRPVASSAAAAQEPDHESAADIDRRNGYRAAPLAELLERARRGDVDAMLETAVRLQNCSTLRLGEAQLRIAQIEAELERLAADKTVAPAAADEALRSLRTNLDGHREMLANCESIPPDQRGRAEAWLETAAETGNHNARRRYVMDVFLGYRDAADYIRNIDEVIRRRDLARRYVREEIARCAPYAFSVQAASLDFSLGVGDPVQRAAASYAAVLEDESSAVDEVRARRDQTYASFENEARSLDAAARARAVQQAEAMVRHCRSTW